MSGVGLAIGLSACADVQREPGFDVVLVIVVGALVMVAGALLLWARVR